MSRRVLLFNTDLEIGGTPRVVRELAVRLHDPPRVYVEVACLGRWGPVADELRERDIHVTALGARGPADFPLALWRLVRLIHWGSDASILPSKEARPATLAGMGFDTIFSFLMHANAVAATAGLFCRDVRFLQSIQTTQPNPAWHWPIQALAARTAEHIVVPSASVATVAHQRACVPPDRIVIIPNALDLSAFGPSPIPLTQPTPFPIGFIGRLDPVKCLPDLLEAVRILNNRVHLHIFGDGLQRCATERLIHHTSIEKWVTLHGQVARPQEALRRIGMLILPSLAEGFPLVLIEAMAAGVPIVATDAPGIRDVIVHNRNGVLVPIHSPVALADAIARLIDDPARRQALIARALADVSEQFTWNRVLVQYRKLLHID